MKKRGRFAGMRADPDRPSGWGGYGAKLPRATSPSIPCGWTWRPLLAPVVRHANRAKKVFPFFFARREKRAGIAGQPHRDCLLWAREDMGRASGWVPWARSRAVARALCLRPVTTGFELPVMSLAGGGGTSQETKTAGCSNDLWASICGPVGILLVAVDESTEGSHSVDASDSPTSTSLFQPPADHVLAGPFDLAAADGTALGQPSGIFEAFRVVFQIGG